jgi:hypothetical protein
VRLDTVQCTYLQSVLHCLPVDGLFSEGTALYGVLACLAKYVQYVYLLQYCTACLFVVCGVGTVLCPCPWPVA